MELEELKKKREEMIKIRNGLSDIYYSLKGEFGERYSEDMLNTLGILDLTLKEFHDRIEREVISQNGLSKWIKES